MPRDSSQDILWTMALPQARVQDACVRVAQEVLRADPFCLWLQGEVGAGKSTWAAEFLWHIGLDRQLAVTSPTFTYAREYEISGETYNHCDLYRIADLATWRALGIDTHNYRGMLIEWATPANCDALPTHCLHIEFCADTSMRQYVFCRA